MGTDQWGTRMQALGAFIRSQRKLANLSLRQLAELSTSQLERGMHQPSVRVLKLISGAPACPPRCITVARWSGWRRAPPSGSLGGYAQIREY